MFLLNLLIFIVVLGVIILLHELGHFLLAKKFNVLCHEYSIGMGPALYKFKKGETTYSIRAIPIGGYVSLAGEDMNDEMISLDQTIGLTFNEENQVIGIITNLELESDITGKLVDFELFDGSLEGFYIELELADGTTTRHEVVENAKYYFGKAKEMQIAPKERSLNSKPIWQRFLIIFAGPLMNFVLAFFLFFVGYMIVGKPVDEAKVHKTTPNGVLKEITEQNFVIEKINDQEISTWDELVATIYSHPGEEITIKITDKSELITINTRVNITLLGISSFGYEDQQLVIGLVDGVGEKTDLKAGDKITHFNDIPVSTWKELIHEIDNYDLNEISISYLRDGVSAKTTYNKILSKSTLIGQGVAPVSVAIGIERATKFNFGYALKMGFVDIGDKVVKILKILGGLFTPRQSGISVSDLSGPIGIFNLIAQVSAGGFAAVLLFMGFLSINIGLLNLLPIPALDGGRLLFLGIEAIIRRPLNRKVEAVVNNIAFILLLGLFVFVMVFDVIRLF